MAKMFYTLEEAAQRLGKSADEVTEMAKSGQIQEFRDRERLMFKVEQIDLLAGGRDDEHGEVGPGGDVIGLADSGEADAIELKEESVLGLEDSKVSSGSGTGVSIFDADELDATDPSELTHISEAPPSVEFSLDSGSSGSGLLDLTREEDDTSLGLDTLEEMYPEEDADMPASASGLFDSGGDEGAMDAGGVGAGAMIMPTVVEVYDGGWSGFSIGAAIGALACLLITCLILMTSHSGTLAGFVEPIQGQYWMYVGGFAGGTFLFGIIGYFVGKASG
ncbi:MAG: hypothetical protein D8M59_03555 [Planctomycetes bacterium]|nr:hypothetical protein [Planctomycetota bacterium]NOG53074.1 hypothetical protein [Planctomycetota bacterium]